LSTKLSTHTAILIILLIVAGAVAASAQYLPSNKVRADDGLSVGPVKTGLYILTGKGSNSLLRLSGHGLILVDGKLPGSYDDLVARAERTSRQPIRALILTNPSEASAGNAATFLKNGTAIILQSNFAEKFVADNFQGRTPPGVVSYDRDYQIRMGGIEAQLMHFGNAYSDGDTVVYFPNLKVIAVGNLYSTVPNPNFTAGGSLLQWGSVLDKVLRLDFDTAVPSTGPAISKAELQAFKVKLDTLTERARRLADEGVSKSQLMSQLKTDDLGWNLNFTPEQVDQFYAELSRVEHSATGR
jgi:hypothetical protein